MNKGPLGSHRFIFYSLAYVESWDCDGFVNVRKLRVDALALNQHTPILNLDLLCIDGDQIPWDAKFSSIFFNLNKVFISRDLIPLNTW